MFEKDILESAGRILAAARGQGVMIATAESCTGGLIASTLTEIAGSSDVFDRGFVTYSNDAKMTMLGVRQKTLETFGAVSAETAGEMADNTLRRSNAALAVSVTGVAGPGGGSAQKPVGLVCFGLARKSGPTTTEIMHFADNGRDGIRRTSVRHALGMLEKALLEAG
jgi:nicotinamide-nucleotide amidase